MSDPFASAQDLYQHVGTSLPTDLARSQQLLGMASAAIRRYTGQTLSQVVGDVVTLEAVERDTLILPQRPVTTITTVVANGLTLSASTEYYSTTIDMRAGLFHSGTLGSRGTNWSYGATVTYDHGYAESSDEYATIKTICMNTVQRALFGPQGEVFGPERVEAAGWSAEIYLTPQDQMALMNLGAVLVG